MAARASRLCLGTSAHAQKVGKTNNVLPKVSFAWFLFAMEVNSSFNLCRIFSRCSTILQHGILLLLVDSTGEEKYINGQT